MGLKNMWNFKQKKDNDESSDDSSDDEDEEPAEKKPVMHSVAIRHYGGVNRIRSQRLGDSTVCSVWNDLGKVQIWNLTNALNQANQMTGPSQTVKAEKYEVPLFTYEGSKQEGFAMAWSPTVTGDLATGDRVKNIYVWHMQEGGQWAIDRKPLTGHQDQIEDLAWSPNEAGLLASVASDKSLRMWDTRVPPAQACVAHVENAHDSDVNVLSWNAHDSLILTGGDDGQLKIWSLKTITSKQPVARFKYHKKPITSVEWHPTETTTFMASSEDNQTTIWDIAMEADGGDEQSIEGVPPQLLFIHMGQKEVKELHWHRQIPGLCLNTAVDGFNVFRPINM
ncbi:hypothetical protein WR25_03647 [Diploscapter pachys]|uniref:Glutamate-rich WD repeat-containing protein 1 n=1 Tax=Diploscapter pachys TaxID=2018661 RepID=A0A2A2KN63_9BILA|nr:hypothetical protein WR25_03647 [Diploscapter pachys]